MKLVSYFARGRAGFGVVKGDGIVALTGRLGLTAAALTGLRRRRRVAVLRRLRRAGFADRREPPIDNERPAGLMTIAVFLFRLLVAMFYRSFY